MQKDEILNEQIKIWNAEEKLQKEIDELLLEQDKLVDEVRQNSKSIEKTEKNEIYSRIWMFIHSALTTTCFFGLLFTSMPALVPSFALGTMGSFSLMVYNFCKSIKYFGIVQDQREEVHKIIKKFEENDLKIDKKLEEFRQIENKRIQNHNLLNEISKNEVIERNPIMQNIREKQKDVDDGLSK